MAEIEIEDLFRLLRERLEGLRVADLPGVPVSGLRFAEALPSATPAVYFLCDASGEILYIGKATNLRLRWWPVTSILDAREIDWEQSQAKLRRAVEAGGSRLSWWAVSREHLATAESLLLQIHRPRWNVHRG